MAIDTRDQPYGRPCDERLPYGVSLLQSPTGAHRPQARLVIPIISAYVPVCLIQ